MTILIANGLFPTNPGVLELLRRADCIICCDGAVTKLLASPVAREPDFIVGDLDSCPPELLERFAKKIVRVPTQNDNDLAKTLRFAFSRGLKELTILGATGLREDHALGNLAHLADFAAADNSLEIITDFGRFVPIVGGCGEKRFATAAGTQVSFFVLSAGGAITARNVKWPLENFAPTRLWEATLNETLGSEIAVSLAPADAKALVYFANKN